MPIFYFHPTNTVARQLSEMSNERGFFYTNRSELEFKIQRLIGEAGYDIWPNFNTVLGTLAGNVEKHLQQSFALDPDNPLDNQTLKLCKSSPTPWSWMKIHNGPKMSFVVGYCSTPALNPHGMSAVQMAQKGIIQTSVVPR